jgi:hypothetical protein
MASRDLTNAYFDRRTNALKRRIATDNDKNTDQSNRLTAGGSSRDDDGDGHSLMLMEVSSIFLVIVYRAKRRKEKKEALICQVYNE